MNTRQVKIGPKLFSKEKAMYRDWVTAIARENLQNSVDAGASHIDIKLEKDGSLVKVTFSDNGPGMDLATLENVYFVLGETTKNSPTSIGGFGVARMLTCFAQEKYTLRTRDILVEGCGAEWTPTTGLPHHKGVEVVAWLDAGERNVLEAFEAYLKSCYIDAIVTLNGARWKTWTYKNKFERHLTFGRVFTNKSKETGIVVRSNGVTMFRPRMSAPFQVVIELDATRSRSILQAHRDGLLQDYQNELESFICELNVNKQSALRQKKSKSIRYEGTGTFARKRKPKALTNQQKADAFEALLLANDRPHLDDRAREALLENPDAFIKAVTGALKENGVVLTVPEPQVAAAPIHSSGYDNEEEERTLNFDLFNVMVEDDTENPRIRKVIESYYPQNWDLLGVNGWRWDKTRTKRQYFRAGVDKYKLLVLWKAACEQMIGLLQDELNQGDDYMEWGVGWHFADPLTTAASCKSDGKMHWLLLNPCNNDGKMRHSLSDKRDMIRLISDAAHEVCHMVYNDHDERFANLLNDLLEEAMANLSGVLKSMAEAKDAAMAELDSKNAVAA